MSTATHPLSWFEQRLGKFIYRNNRPFEVKNTGVAKYCYELQESGFKFDDMEKPKLRIHVVEMPEGCSSCEG